MAILGETHRGKLGARPGLRACALLLIALGWISGQPVATAEEPLASGDQVKAAFLVNFPKYAEWPPTAFAASDSPIVIAVRGDTKVTDELAKVIAGRSVNGRRLILVRLAPGTETGTCHILFVSEAEQRKSPALLATVKPGILTVGESDAFLEGGGIINLALRDRQVAVEVNLTAAANAGIKLSSKLLSVARIVTGKAR